MTIFNEATAELAALEWLAEIGYATLFGPNIAPVETAANDITDGCFSSLQTFTMKPYENLSGHL